MTVLVEFFCMRCRLLAEVSALTFISTVLADRLEDTKVSDGTAVKGLALVYTLMAIN